MSVKQLKMILLLWLALLELLFSGVIIAGDIEIPPSERGFYVSLNIGGSTFQSTETFASTLSGTGIGATASFNIDARNALNFTWGGAFGSKFGRIFQVDITAEYIRFPLRSRDRVLSAQAPAPTTSNVINGSSLVVTLNGYVNIFPIFQNVKHRFIPYFGVGVGISSNKSTDIVNATNVAPTSITEIAGNRRCDFAWRFMFGFNYNLLRQLLLNVQYSYLDAGEYRTGNQFISPPGTVTSIPTVRIRSNMFTAGLTYVFYI